MRVGGEISVRGDGGYTKRVGEGGKRAGRGYTRRAGRGYIKRAGTGGVDCGRLKPDSQTVSD